MTTIDEYTYPDKLENALEMLAAGNSLNEVLAQANSDAEWLALLLPTVAEVAGLQQSIPIPPPDASLQRLLAYGEELAAMPIIASPSNRTSTFWHLFGNWGGRYFVGALAVLLLILVLLGGLNFTAQNSLPGELLFPIKTAGETLQLNLPWNFAHRQQLLERFNQRRQNEVKMLLEQNQLANVAFNGYVTALAGTTLAVDDFTVEITSETEIRGNVTIGTRIHLNSITQPPDKLIALAITVIEPGVLGLETPSPTPTYTPPQVFSPTPEILLLPTATPTPIIADSRALPDPPTVSPTPPQTATPTRTPTKTPTTHETVDDNISDVDDNDSIDDSIDNTEDLNDEDDFEDNDDIDHDDSIDDSYDDDFDDFYDDDDQDQNNDSNEDNNDNLDHDDDDDDNSNDDNDNDNS